MGLKEVKKGLEKELDQKTKAILKEAEDEKKKILDAAKQKVKDYKEKAEKEAEERMATLERSDVASTKLQAKKKLLSEKKEAIDQVFDDVKEKLVSMTPKKRESYLKNLIARAEKEIDVALVKCSPKDKKLIKGYDVETDDSIEGGVLCESKDGNSRIDLTYDVILKQVREENLKEVAEELF